MNNLLCTNRLVNYNSYHFYIIIIHIYPRLEKACPLDVEGFIYESGKEVSTKTSNSFLMRQKKFKNDDGTYKTSTTTFVMFILKYCDYMTFLNTFF